MGGAPVLAGEYAITVDRSNGARLGCEVDHQDGVTLEIDEIRPGLIAAWNAVNPTLEVRAGHRIVEVNGVRNDGFLLADECKKKQVLHIKLRRAAPRSK